MTTLASPAGITMNATFWMATAIFCVAYVVICTEKINKTIVALVGASLVLMLDILTQAEAFHTEELGVDWNVIFLLISMMIIINILRPTGVFEYLAVKSAKWGKGNPVRIMAVYAIVTATVSAFLDNVTTVLLIAPVTLLISDALEVDAVPFLIVEAIASNIGGTATLIGDPPNIMIASKAQLDFMDFVYHLTPVIIIVMVVFLLTVKVIFRKRLQTREELKIRIMQMNESDAIKDPVLLRKGVVVLALALLGFLLHGVLGLAPATIALAAASLLLLISGIRDPAQVFAEVEWPTLFFFIGLFIIVGGVVKVGLIAWLSTEVLKVTQGSLFATSMLIMWFSAFASAIIDNIPYVATMNPLIIDLARQIWPNLSGVALLQNPDLLPIWWSLALGACLGGNGTAIGASANVIVCGMAAKAGRHISFARFTLYGLPIMILTVAVCTVYVWLRYYVLKF